MLEIHSLKRNQEKSCSLRESNLVLKDSPPVNTHYKLRLKSSGSTKPITWFFQCLSTSASRPKCCTSSVCQCYCICQNVVPVRSVSATVSAKMLYQFGLSVLLYLPKCCTSSVCQCHCICQNVVPVRSVSATVSAKMLYQFGLSVLLYLPKCCTSSVCQCYCICQNLHPWFNRFG